MKVELGSGLYPRDGYIHLDVDSTLQSVDIVGNILHLPFKYNSIDEIILINTLEHFFYDEVIYILNEIYNTLKPKGIFKCYVPDILEIYNKIINEENSENCNIDKVVNYINWIYGVKGKYNQHHFGFTKNLLVFLVSSIGYNINNIENTDGIYIECYK